jgi:multidrug efflux pump subunit AcrA (membrane-fusion protein)
MNPRHCHRPTRENRSAAFWLAAGIVLVAGCRPVAKADDPAADDEAVAPVKVEVRPVVRAALDETVEVLGTTQPLRSKTARVTTAVEGRVAEILPEASEATRHTIAEPLAARAVEGQLVNERQVIARLDDNLARAAVAKAEGALAEAQAAASAQSTPRPQQLQAAETAVATAQSAQEAAEAQLKRLQEVSKLVGDASLADAKTAVERARTEKHAADARLAELSELPALRKAAELQAKVRAADADLKAAQMQLELTKIRSPIAGRLGRINVFLGQSLPVGTPVATVTDLRQIEVEAAVPAKRIHQLQVGQSATISWGDEAAPHSLAGKVTFVGQEIEPGSGSFPVSIVAENPDERLRSGLHVQARIIVRHLDKALVVPRAAVIEETEEPYLFLAEEKSEKEMGAVSDKSDPAEKGQPQEKSGVGEKPKLIAHKTAVKLGVRSGDLLQVEGEGIKEGALVVTKNNYFVSDKAALEIDSGDEKKE